MNYSEWKAQYCKQYAIDYLDDDLAREAFSAGAEAMRERCAKVAEQAGYDSLAEKAHGRYIAERIRDGDKPV